MNIYIYIGYSVCACETAIADSSRLRNVCYSVLEFGLLGRLPLGYAVSDLVKAYSGLSSSTLWLAT